MADTLNKLEQDSLAVASETGYRKNTSFRIGNLFYRFLQFFKNLFGGTYLLGEKENVAAIKAIPNPTKGDTWRAKDTDHYWTYDGKEWNDIGIVLPSDVVRKEDLSVLENKVNYSIRLSNYNNIVIEENVTVEGDSLKAIKITIKAKTTFYVSIKAKSEKRITFEEDTEFIIPYNCFMYYKYSTNEFIITAEKDLQSFDDYIELANSHIGVLVSGWFQRLLFRYNGVDLASNINNSVKIDYEKVKVFEQWRISGNPHRGIRVVISAGVTLFFNRFQKSEQKIMFDVDTSFDVPRNSFLYYDISTNELLISPSLKPISSHILMAESYAGLLYKGYFKELKNRESNSSIRLSDYENITVTENHDGTSVRVFFPKDKIFYFASFTNDSSRITFTEDTEFIVPHNCYLYYKISNNTLFISKANTLQTELDHILIADVHQGIVVNGFLADLALRQKMTVLNGIPIDIKSSIKLSTYDKIKIVETEGKSPNTVTIIFTIQTTLYYNRLGKAEERLTLPSGTEYVIPHNSYLYYNSTTNELEVTSGKPQGAMNYELLLENHAGWIVSGFFAHLADRLRIKNIESNNIVDKYDIPDFYKDHFKEKFGVLAKYDRLTGSNSDSFVFVTDSHAGANNYTSASLIRGIISKRNISKVFFGGDVITAYGSKDVLFDQAEEQLNKYNDFFKPYATVYNVRGNHDFTIRTSSTDASGYTAPIETVYSYFMKDIESLVIRDLANPNSLYYFHDNKNAKIRYFHLNSCDAQGDESVSWGVKYGISQKQYEWLIESLQSLESGWSVFIVSHIAMNQNITGSSASYAPLKGILEAFQAATSYNYTGTISGFDYNINVDFSANTSKIICILSGHEHKDRQIYENGILNIITACDAHYSDDGITRSQKTVNESCFDTCLIDGNNKIMRFVRFGAGYDRIYHYNDPMLLTVGDTSQIVSELAGKLTYQSSDESKVTINASGLITAVASGTCMITAIDANNNKEFFEITI